MKKLWVWFLVLVLCLGAIAGAFFIGRLTADKNFGQEKTKGNTTYKVEYLQDSYVQGDSIVFEIIATSDVKFTSLTFSVDNEEDETLNVKTGESKYSTL